MEKILNYKNESFLEKLNFFITKNRGTGIDISAQVKDIIYNVEANGDNAIYQLTLDYDNYDIFINTTVWIIATAVDEIRKAIEAPTMPITGKK